MPAAALPAEVRHRLGEMNATLVALVIGCETSYQLLNLEERSKEVTHPTMLEDGCSKSIPCSYAKSSDSAAADSTRA